MILYAVLHFPYLNLWFSHKNAFHFLIFILLNGWRSLSSPHCIHPPLNTDWWKVKRHRTNAWEWLHGRTAQGHVIPLWAECEWKRGLFHMGLVSWWPAPEMWVTLSCLCIQLSRNDRSCAMWWDVKYTWYYSASVHLTQVKSIHTHVGPMMTYAWDRSFCSHTFKSLPTVLCTLYLVLGWMSCVKVPESHNQKMIEIWFWF